MKPLVVLFLLDGLWPTVQSFEFPVADEVEATTGLTKTLFARDDDPSDFGWVKRWAAVGDSFTAGIGSGSPLGNPLKDEPGNSNWYCARYDTSYPMIVNDALGPSVKNFQFEACSGDRTGGIYKQIEGLKGDLDLVMMTAGGNDLCLASMIDKCVFRPFSGESACTDVIDIAQDNLDNILKSNLKQLLDALNDKMNDDSIVVLNGYAQFFNTENEDCANDQDWTLVNLWGQDGLTLTVDRRKKFNKLVVQINDVIESVVEDAKKNSKYKFYIGFSNWDLWPRKGVAGQFCDPSSTGRYPDSDQPDLQFFKPDTSTSSGGELKRSVEGNDVTSNITAWDAYLFNEELQRHQSADLYKSILFNSPNPRAEARHMLDRRAPSPPGCPGDTEDEIQPPSIGLPNFIAKNFHPNELGHYTIASWALQTMVDLRAEVLGVDAPSCKPTDKFTCWQGTGSKAYASEEQLNDNYEEFCDAVEAGDEKGWTYKDKYFEGTPDETEFKVTLSSSADRDDKFTTAKCKESLKRIIHGCDGNDSDNPLNWKFGGEWERGNFKYQVNPQRTTRPWPVIQEVSGQCKGWYHGLWSSYEIFGSGWASYDHGQKTLLPEAKSCIGGGLTMWKFEYLDGEDYEFKATFNTPIWVRSRCFKNNKAVFAAGGFTDGCGGND